MHWSLQDPAACHELTKRMAPRVNNPERFIGNRRVCLLMLLSMGLPARSATDESERSFRFSLATLLPDISGLAPMSTILRPGGRIRGCFLRVLKCVPIEQRHIRPGSWLPTTLDYLRCFRIRQLQVHPTSRHNVLLHTANLLRTRSWVRVSAKRVLFSHTSVPGKFKAIFVSM